MNLRHTLLAASIATAAVFSAMLPASARPGVLIGQAPGTQVNVRSAPSMQSNAPSYGLVGDRVQVLRVIVNEGNAWYSVKFDSGIEGWIRGDFVGYQDDGSNYGVLMGSAGDRINVRSAPSTQASSPSYGLNGDFVKILSETSGSDGYQWRYVQFPSGIQGWVRGDLVRPSDAGGC